MKAHIPASQKLSKKSRETVKEYIENCEQDHIRRLLKMACVTLHQDFGFGTQRLSKFLSGMTKLSLDKDEILWEHMDKLIIDQMRIKFEREK